MHTLHSNSTFTQSFFEAEKSTSEIQVDTLKFLLRILCLCPISVGLTHV